MSGRTDQGVGSVPVACGGFPLAGHRPAVAVQRLAFFERVRSEEPVLRLRMGRTPTFLLITERTGLPLSVGISGANLHDSQALEPLVRGIPQIRFRRGPRRRKPAKLQGDKGYDYAHLRKWLHERGIRHRIARKGIESSNRLGRHRWVIERTMAWLAGCRRLHRRYERKAEHFLAFTSIACTLICYRRLAK
ncbi:IS5 family transposase [Streptomyces sp. IBSBF 2394]|uniref:IS5 family transposase n=1 Tax=Streptomyces sp. IBSBF 2394 TaxID=2903532 RepID=UPI002FDC3BB7